MAVCRAFVWFPPPGLFIGLILIPLTCMDGHYMGVAISKNSSTCMLNCMLFHSKKIFLKS